MKTIAVHLTRIGFALVLGLLSPVFAGCGDDGDDRDDPVRQTIVVNSVDDLAAPPDGVVTLRSAIASVRPPGRIVFDPALDGAVISLNIVGEEHSMLPAETYTGMTFDGYHNRDYGASALSVDKDLIIDASDLPVGITIRWDGAIPARVIAASRDLVLRHLTITGGHAQAAALADPNQPFTLARGGGIAAWGKTVIERCRIHGNFIEGDSAASRDRGAFGGGVYGNILVINDSIVSGNRARGYGAAGGGVYSVGGWMSFENSMIERSSVTGNRTTAQHSYGGGVFSAGGGPGGRNLMVIINSTLARNLVEDNPDISEAGGPPTPQYYYRGGGLYLGNGSATVISSTVAENAVTGWPATFSGKPNMGGGGICATIGSAHVVENLELRQSVVVGNLVGGADDDIFSGSLLHFYSEGYNLVGRLNFDYILVPIPPWWSLSRKHYPKVGDEDGVTSVSALDVDAVVTSPTIVSRGVDDGADAVRWYPPGPWAVDRVPGQYRMTYAMAQYRVIPGHLDDFLYRVLVRLRDHYGFGPAFGAALVYNGVSWTGDDSTWVTDPANTAWIKFWRDLDAEIGDDLGAARLGDDFWGGIETGPFGPNGEISIARPEYRFGPPREDQQGRARPAGAVADIGAIEREN